jgi:hypothetical protein
VEKTRRELLRAIEEDSGEFFHHRWMIRWMKAQFKLDIATFDSETEVLCLVDYAAVYSMKGHYVGTCEFPMTSNQLVILALHNPKPLVAGSTEEREVTCDYWRFWCNHKGDAPTYHQALKIVARHYRAGAVPLLKAMKMWSDGQRAQFKGRKNFGRMALLPKPPPLGDGLSITHNFFESHHGSGPHDNAGKDPRRMMDRAVINQKDNIYNYVACFDWCSENMAAPSEQSHKGTWGANGQYYWAAISDGADTPPTRVCVLDENELSRDWDVVAGSNRRFVVRAVNSSPLVPPEVESQFVPCYCKASREGGLCGHSHITGEWNKKKIAELPLKRSRRRAMVVDDDDDDDDDDD